MQTAIIDMSATSSTAIFQKTGIALFTAALLLFTGSILMGPFRLQPAAVEQALSDPGQRAAVAARLAPMQQRSYPHSFAFIAALDGALRRAQADLAAAPKPAEGQAAAKPLPDWQIKSLYFPVAKAGADGPMRHRSGLFFFLSIGLGILGALLYILPGFRSLPGIKHNGIYHSSMHHRGWLGIAAGVWLIGFYIFLYFFPHYLVNAVILVDPVSKALNGGEASHWFLYGFLYTVAIVVMGLRMVVKYRHNNYHLLRTASVVFFQVVFAFTLPEILAALHQPAVDLKNIWPLDYSFFFEYRLDKLMASGGFGLFLLFWGLALMLVGVPLFTYLYGKRWYCSWVCGCGGLAETLGDPYRQLSDKSTPAWQIERWLIHAVLAFAIVMTGLVLYTYFGGKVRLSLHRGLIVAIAALTAAAICWWQTRRHPGIPQGKLYRIAAIIVAAVAGWQWLGYTQTDSAVMAYSSYDVRTVYGFSISSIFAGVVGTGFYPLMGNRVWCRFGCPLAAYLGLVQRLRSRFRITVNGGQCISCGNCSTYCEMGIDVRAYAQRGQDVVRASCVGCGVCAAVCPRGVLRLENAAEDAGRRAADLRVIQFVDGEVRLG